MIVLLALLPAAPLPVPVLSSGCHSPPWPLPSPQYRPAFSVPRPQDSLKVPQRAVRSWGVSPREPAVTLSLCVSLRVSALVPSLWMGGLLITVAAPLPQPCAYAAWQPCFYSGHPVSTLNLLSHFLHGSNPGFLQKIWLKWVIFSHTRPCQVAG